MNVTCSTSRTNEASLRAAARGGRRSRWRKAQGWKLKIDPRASVLTLIALGTAAFWGVLPAAAAEPMSFRVTQIGGANGVCGRKCAEVISAEGEINNGTADDFVAFLSSHVQEDGLRPVVLIESPGGTVVGAMQLGMVFRKIGAAVIVAQTVEDGGADRIRLRPGLCMSACVYAFFGGVKRVVPSVSKLGIHRMVINENVRDPTGGYTLNQTYGTDDIVNSLEDYTKFMGVDPGVIVFAEHIAPDSIHIVTPKQIQRWRMGSPHL